MVTSFAPVLIITLNRNEKFEACIESLKRNLYADSTDLFIALDYPLHIDHFEGYNKTLTYLENLTGFKSINIIKREKNYGIIKNYLDAKELVFSLYDRVIFTEDDNEFSFDFLNFMNKCLEEYKNDKSIFSISGYNYPVKIPNNYKHHVYKWMGHSAWGFGVWKDRWEQITWNPDLIFNVVDKFLHDYINVYKFQKVANHYLPAMLSMIEHKKISGDGYICLHQFRNGYYSIFPIISRVRNHGHDGTGRSKSFILDSPYSKQQIYRGLNYYELPNDPEINQDINKLLHHFFLLPIKTKIKAVMKLLLLNAGLWPNATKKRMF